MLHWYIRAQLCPGKLTSLVSTDIYTPINILDSTLDTLFWDFIDLVNPLLPLIGWAEANWMTAAMIYWSRAATCGADVEEASTIISTIDSNWHLCFCQVTQYSNKKPQKRSNLLDVATWQEYWWLVSERFVANITTVDSGEFGCWSRKGANVFRQACLLSLWNIIVAVETRFGESIIRNSRSGWEIWMG